MEERFNPEACKLRHESDERRIIALEETLKKIFAKLDQFAQRPTWLILGIISFLASGLCATVTIILKG